jgi:ubiquinone biosynthesis protein
MPLYRTYKTYRHLGRLRQVANVLIKHGFGHLVQRLNLEGAVSWSRRLSAYAKLQTEDKISMAERMRMVLEDLGPTFVKFGQILSARPDLVPADFINEFKKLQDEVPPFPFSQAQDLIEDELGVPLSTHFSNFQPEVLASASIAQVHRASLLDGTPVIMKVQRPQIERTMEGDLNIFLTLAQLVERYLPETRSYNPVGMVEELSRTLHKELNFTLEAANIIIFQKNFKEVDYLHVPRVYEQLTTRRVLTVEHLEGIPADEKERLLAQGYDLQKILNRGANIFLKQIFIDGFFHADPHAGNVLVMPGEVIALLDFGQVGYIDQEIMEAHAVLFLALLERDYTRMTQQLTDLGLLEGVKDVDIFRRDLRDFIEPYYGRDLKDIPLGRVLNEAVGLAFKHHLHLPPEAVLLSKAIITLDGLTRQLDPGFNLLEVSKPYAHKIILQRLSPERLAGKLVRSLEELNRFFSHFPSQVRGILKKVLEDDLKIEFRHRGLENFIREMDRSSNRMAFSFIISAVIVGSSLIMLSGKGTLFMGFPLLGIMGYLIAGILGLGLAVAILRSGRL